MTTNDQANFTLTTEYSTPYSALIRDDVVMGVPRYFLERWLPVLGPAPATVVNTLRQLDYRCEDDVVTISGDALAREASMSRRHLYTCLETPWINAFIRQDSGQHQRTPEGKIIQQANHYHVRMDDPLTPADAEHLSTILPNFADTPLAAVERALERPARDLWAADPGHPTEHFTTSRALTAQDALQRAFPTWTASDTDQQQAFAQAAEKLHRHITLVRQDGRTSKIIVPQYFRRRWWDHLGHDRAWVYLWLRGYVYDNPEENIRRDTCWVPSLQTLLNIIGRSREWWRRNIEKATPKADYTLDDFFTQTDSQKGRDPKHPQRVARQFKVALDIPIAPEDQARYTTFLEKWPSPGIPPQRSATNKHTGKEEVCHKQTHRPEKGLPQTDTPAIGRSATNEHTGKKGVRHKQTQGSATPAHSNTESSKKASNIKSSASNSSSKQPAVQPSKSSATNLAAAANTNNDQKEDGQFLSLTDQLRHTLQHSPDTPLFQAATVECWLSQTWSESVLPHTPAWTLATNGNVAARDLLAMILAVWVDKSIQHPPRYLSWLLQRWLDQPDSPPVEHWAQFQALAALPIGQWFEQGRQMWLELAPQGHRTLPFGLDNLRQEDEQPEESGAVLCAEDSPPVLPLMSTPDPPVPQTAEEIWLATTNKLSVKLTRSAYHNWIRGTEAVAYADGVLTVNAKHPIVRDWLTERLNPSIEQTASAVAQRPVQVRYTAEPRTTPKER